MKYIFILILSLSSILCLSQTTIKYNVIGGGNIFMISNKDNKRIIFDIPQFKDTLSNFREVPLNDYNPYFIKQEFTCRIIKILNLNYIWLKLMGVSVL